MFDQVDAIQAGVFITLLIVVAYYTSQSHNPHTTIHWKNLTPDELDQLVEDWDAWYTVDNRKVVYQEGEEQEMINFIRDKRWKS